MVWLWRYLSVEMYSCVGACVRVVWGPVYCVDGPFGAVEKINMAAHGDKNGDQRKREGEGGGEKGRRRRRTKRIRRRRKRGRRRKEGEGDNSGPNNIVKKATEQTIAQHDIQKHKMR